MTTTDITTASRAVTIAAEMADAAQAFVDSLDAGQRAVATFPFEGDERYLWHYTPVERNGLRLKDMTGVQRTAAFRMLNTALSAHGARKAREIIDLEAILDEWEGIQNSRMHWLRDPEIYYFSIFGEPGGERPWGWRAGGITSGFTPPSLPTPTCRFCRCSWARTRRKSGTASTRACGPWPMKRTWRATCWVAWTPGKRRAP